MINPTIFTDIYGSSNANRLDDPAHAMFRTIVNNEQYTLFVPPPQSNKGIAITVHLIRQWYKDVTGNKMNLGIGDMAKFLKSMLETNNGLPIPIEDITPPEDETPPTSFKTPFD